MKLTLPANELNEAVKGYLQRTYSIYSEVIIQELQDVEVEVNPVDRVASNEFVSVEEVTSDTERDAAIAKADELGIKYRSDISTDKLIERIEERELELAKSVASGEELFEKEEPMVESEETDKDDSDETKEENQEDEEEKPKEKKSIFAK